MSTLLTLQSFQACWSEVPAIVRAFLYEPTEQLLEGDLYAVFPVVLGRGITPYPKTGPGQYVVEREFIFRVLIAPFQKASLDSLDEGAYVDKLAVEFIDSPATYFMTGDHIRLASNAVTGFTAPMKGLEKDIS